MNVFEAIKVDSASHFIRLMRRSHDLWQGRNDTETDWIFRGQPNWCWHLEPSAHRHNAQTGIPTLLLDWTFDPLVAAYFAAEGIVDEPDSDALAVWALRRSLFETKKPWPLARFTVRAGLTPFVDGQAALFTWCPSIYQLKLAHGKLPRFDTLVRSLATNPDFATRPCHHDFAYTT